jgi:hypothetical protein
MGLFEKAQPMAERLKMYIYGASGTGKTITSLHFPDPAVIDTERGTDHYGEFFEFNRIQSGDPSIVQQAIDELLTNPGGTKTFVIDSFTNLYEQIVDRQVTRQKMKTGNPNYQIQPLDYKFIKADVRSIVQKMLALDMNVIVTARSKVLYSQEEFMKPIGTTPDGPKELPYMFDIVLELKTENGVHEATVVKDRTNKLPQSFEFTYKAFTGFIGIDGLERDPVVFDQQIKLDQRSGRNTAINFKGTEIKTAGVQAETLEKLENVFKEVGDESFIKSKLKTDYLSDSILDLRDDEGKLLLADLQAKLKN